MERLDRVAGKQTVRLTHYGRKSGKAYEVTIWFVVDGEWIYLGTANVNRQWVRNVQKTPKVKLAIGDERFEGTARFLADRPSTTRHKQECERNTGCTARFLRLCRFSWS